MTSRVVRNLQNGVGVLLLGASGALLAHCGSSDTGNLPVPSNNPSLGASAAPVVMQEVADFECPYCQEVQSTVDQVMQNYDGGVLLVWRDYPIHSTSELTAEAAREVYAQAGNNGFWAYHDMLFADQHMFSESDLEGYAQQLGGIDMDKFRAALANHTHQAEVQADVNAVDNSGVSQVGTPMFFINGRVLIGAVPYDQFSNAIDNASK